MQLIKKIFTIGYSLITGLFTLSGFVLIYFAVITLWHGIDPAASTSRDERLNIIIEGIGLLTIAVATLELGQTILEEEVQRTVYTSAPTRVRRFLSRFLIVIVVALVSECLVAVFQAIHEDPSQVPYAALIGITAAFLLAAWGVFIRLNRSAEELEPEAMEQTKREDTVIT